jgi:hypothetical protein
MPRFRTAHGLGAIRIGGFVQFRDEVHISPTEIHKTWRQRPCFKMGIGCEACKAKFRDIEAECARANAQREMLIQLLAAAKAQTRKARLAGKPDPETQKAIRATFVRCPHGLPDASMCGGWPCRGKAKQFVAPVEPTIEVPRELTPFINVFEETD